MIVLSLRRYLSPVYRAGSLYDCLPNTSFRMCDGAKSRSPCNKIRMGAPKLKRPTMGLVFCCPPPVTDAAGFGEINDSTESINLSQKLFWE